MWYLPGKGIEPVSPALAGGFLTTVPPGKPKPGIFLNDIYYTLIYLLIYSFSFFFMEENLKDAAR